MRPANPRLFAFFKLILVCSLLATACTFRSSSKNHFTQTPAMMDITHTPIIIPIAEGPQETNLPEEELDARMAKLVDFVPLAGLAIGIHFKGETYEQGFGLADLEGRTPVTAQTVFSIGSLTKSFTAAAILHLSEQGKLKLDDPISRFTPGTPAVAKNIQIRHFLNHTSGLPDLSIDEAQEALPETFATAEAIEYYFSTVQSLEFEPGTAWSYNNLGYYLLGAIIENVSGMKYDEYFKSTFFEPLGLTSSAECSPELDLSGYHSVNRQLEAAHSSNLKLVGAAGALCSNVGDLLRWLDTLAHGKVIRPEMWEQMITPLSAVASSLVSDLLRE